MGPWLVLLVALLFILLFGGLALLRKEPLSIRAAVEGLILTGLVYLAYWVTGVLMNPVLFLIILYLVTMRSRVLVDLANMVARRGRFDLAHRLYGWAERVGHEASTKYVSRINLGACLLKERNLERAIEVLSSVEQEAKDGNLGIKYEAACRYNLGIALMRSGRTSEAVHQLNEVLDLLPASIYAIGARSELKRHRQATSGAGETSEPGSEPEKSDTETKEA
jgi:tetratricopeptide (TPR) repeat protein